MIWIDCGGTVDGIRKIKGCFGALNITKYVNLENGLMKHPNEIFAVKMANRSKCSMSIDFENINSHGRYQCGVVLNTPSSRYQYVTFVSVNVTKTDMVTVQGNSTIEEGQKLEQGKVRNTTNFELEVTKWPPSFGRLLWIQIIGMEIFFATLAVIAWIFLKRIKTTTPNKDTVLDREWIFQANQPDCTIPLPMEIIPTDSLTRWTGNRRKERTPFHGPCVCIKEPLPSLDPIAFV